MKLFWVFEYYTHANTHICIPKNIYMCARDKLDEVVLSILTLVIPKLYITDCFRNICLS